MEQEKLINDPIKGFGLNRFSYEEHGTLEAKSSKKAQTDSEIDAGQADGTEAEPGKVGEKADESEETTLNTSGVQEGPKKIVPDKSA